MYNENNRMVLENSLTSAEDIQRTMIDFTQQFEMAIEAKHLAFQQKREADRTYDEAEAEFVFDITFTDEDYGKAKNAETRKIVLDAKLVKARSEGPLRSAWQAKLAAERRLEDADLAYAQAEAKFKAVRAAANLQAAHLGAVAVA